MTTHQRIGSRVSHYLILGRLGTGGCGVVYLARDLALGRMAALKLLSDGVSDAHKRRLMKEGRESARLQHPTIATFYEAGEEDGEVFLAMEYVRGQSLRQRLARGALEIGEALSAASDLMAAVSHAHFSGILHRDIKPENIMLKTSGGLKLVDFGLAMPVLPDGPSGEESEAPVPGWEQLSRRTEVGAIVGTPGYMSPEQVLGDATDARCDVFSIGAVLYEMLTGKPAFPGRTSRERMLAVFQPGPNWVTSPGLPRGIQTLVERALARDRADRHASVAALLLELQQTCKEPLSGGAPPSIAVLDLRATHSSDAWTDHALTDAVRDSLSRLEGLRVVPRTRTGGSSPPSPGADLLSDAIRQGQQMGCRYVVSGEIEQAKDTIRATLLLLDVAADQSIGEFHVDGKASDLFAIRDRLCSEIAGKLLGSVEPVWSGTDPIPPTRLDAYRHHSRAEALLRSQDRGAFETGAEHYRRAMELDPSYADPIAGLALLTALRFTYTGSLADLSAGVELAQRAVTIDPTCGRAYTALTYASWRLGRLAEADEASKRARSLAPEDALVHYFSAAILYELGRLEEAVGEAQRAIECDPMHAYAWYLAGSMLLDLERLEEAVWCLRQCVDLERRGAKVRTPGAGHALAEGLRRLGRLDEARDQCITALESIEGGDHMHRDVFRCQALITLGRVSLDRGDRDGARASFSQAVGHARGRHRMSAGGHLFVQSLAGLARTASDPVAWDEAIQTFDRREGYDFGLVMQTHDSHTLADLVDSARSLGLEEQARALESRLTESRLRWLGDPAVRRAEEK